MRLNQRIPITAFIAALFFSASVLARVPAGDLLEGVMPGPDGKIHVLTVFPHQDDETFFVGGTLLKMKNDPRVVTHSYCMTLGDASEAKDILGITPEKLGRMRIKELELAAEVLDIDEVIQGNYHDQHLAEHPEEARQKILDIINRVGAQVVITFGPEGITMHTDHRAEYKFTREVFPQSNAQKLFLVSMPKPIYRILAHPGVTPIPPTIAVDIKDQKKLKMQALRSHASQTRPMSMKTVIFAIRFFDHEYFALIEKP